MESKRTLRDRSSLKKPVRFREKEQASVSASSMTALKNPRSTKEAMNGIYATHWAKAHDAFIDQNISLGSWEFVDKKAHHKPVPPK